MADDRQADQPQTDEPLVILCRLGQYQEASLIRQALEAEGIPSMTDGENFSALFGLGAEAPMAMKVLVRKSDRPRAVEIVKQMQDETETEIDVIEED